MIHDGNDLEKKSTAYTLSFIAIFYVIWGVLEIGESCWTAPLALFCMQLAMLYLLFIVEPRTWQKVGAAYAIFTTICIAIVVIDKTRDQNCVVDGMGTFCQSLFRDHTCPVVIVIWSPFSISMSRQIFFMDRLKIMLVTGSQLILQGVIICVASPSTLTDYKNFLAVFIGIFSTAAISLSSVEQSTFHNEKMRTVIRDLEAHRTSQRIMAHHIKNLLGETMATIEMYLEDEKCMSITHLHRSVSQIRRGIQLLQRSLKLAKIYNGTHIPEPKIIHLREYLSKFAPSQTTLNGCCGCYFKLTDMIIPDLYAALTFGNCVTHGGDDIQVDCLFTDECLRIDVHNNIRDSTSPSNQRNAYQHLSAYSTGLGLSDLESVCHLLGTYVDNRLIHDRWHSVIELRAMRVESPEHFGIEELDKDAITLPAHVKVCVIDDQAMIPKAMKFKIMKQYPLATVQICILKNDVGYKDFCSMTLPKYVNSWDIVILDQNMPMDDSRVTLYGTDVLRKMKEAGCTACFVIHSGDCSSEDEAEYARHGADGTISKGADSFMLELTRIYSSFRKHL